ncbi:hypothetical protein ACI2JA_03850 [Alkalihalobacillus sp. NPDC078783]
MRLYAFQTGLSYILKINNVNYKEFGEMIDVSKQQVSMWACGKRSIPKKQFVKFQSIAFLSKFDKELLESEFDYQLEAKINKVLQTGDLTSGELKQLRINVIQKRMEENFRNDTSDKFLKCMEYTLNEYLGGA